MRAIWKGAVSFGLVSVPVKLYAATESHDVSFRQVHAKDGGRIKYQRVCSLDGEEVPYSDIAKGYETEDGEMVILSDDDMAELPATSSREIAVEKFVPSDQIDPMLFEKSYYLEPEKSGAKPYALLRQALKDADRMAVVTVALRQRTSVAVLRVRQTDTGDVIVLQTMMWPDEVRVPDFDVEVGDVKDAEVKMAHMLVETLAGDFDASEFEDDYAGAVEALVKAKIEGGEVKRTETSTKTSGEVVDLLAALQKSVAAAKTARGEAPVEDSSDDGSDELRRGRSAREEGVGPEGSGQEGGGEEGPRQEDGSQEDTGEEDRGQEGQLSRARRTAQWRCHRRTGPPAAPSGSGPQDALVRVKRRVSAGASPRAAAESGIRRDISAARKSDSRGATRLSTSTHRPMAPSTVIGRSSRARTRRSAQCSGDSARRPSYASVGPIIGVRTRATRMLVQVTLSKYASRPMIRPNTSSALLAAMYAANLGALTWLPQVTTLSTCPKRCARMAGSSPMVSRTGPK